MMIYITTKFHGKVGNGHGEFVIAGGDPVKGFSGEIKDVSWPRFNALVCLTAVQNVPAGETLTLTLQDAYAASMIASGHCEGANTDVWEKVYDRIHGFKAFKVVRDKNHRLVSWKP